MNCYYHRDREAVGICVSCGKPICMECKAMLGEKFYCNTCADKIFTGASIPPKARELNWFYRHLNWTYILGYVVVLVLCFIAGFILGSIDPYVADEILDVVTYLISFIVMLPMSIWVLKRKNRSLWWLLLAGWLSPLWLRNKSNQT